jgi:hypothetical protein
MTARIASVVDLAQLFLRQGSWNLTTVTMPDRKEAAWASTSAVGACGPPFSQAGGSDRFSAVRWLLCVDEARC